MKSRWSMLVMGMIGLLPVSSAWAAEAVLNSGDTAWLIVSTALVMMMTPAGLALFYGGMSRYKNLLNTLAMTFVAYCLTSVVWVMWGYSLAFGPDKGGIIGGLDFFFFSGITPASLEGTIPTNVFALFQMTFACITVALVLGSIVDRMKFSAWILFTVLWVTFVYCPVAHWVWGKGWMASIGALDFAGGTVVHINAGVAGLVLALVLGKRIGFGREAMFPSSIALTALGAALLWFGWFGFNAGSALAANELAANAFVTTTVATAAAGLTWAVIEWMMHKAPTALGAVSGAVAGLVAITPACGFVNPMNAIFIGMFASLFCYLAIAKVKSFFRYDDSLDVFGIHGVGGIWGTLATGLFAEKAVNEAGANGLFFGNAQLFGVQCMLVVVTIAFAALMTWAIFKLVDSLMCVRVEKTKEIVGLDLTQHSESAYTLVD